VRSCCLTILYLASGRDRASNVQPKFGMAIAQAEPFILLFWPIANFTERGQAACPVAPI
jgi:hypothetical protein